MLLNIFVASLYRIHKIRLLTFSAFYTMAFGLLALPVVLRLNANYLPTSTRELPPMSMWLPKGLLLCPEV